MQANLLSIILGFIEGFALIISPCILPILPIVLAGSLAGSSKRPFGIVCGFTLAFALFAFFSRQLVQYSAIDLNVIRYISYGILLLLGLIMLSSYLTERFSLLTQRLASVGNALAVKNGEPGGFLSGFGLGCLIAIVWTPCAGPILAAVIVQIVIQKATIIGFFTLIAFALGASIPMLIIVFYGRKLTNTFHFFQAHASYFRKLLGIIIIASVGYMVYQEQAQNYTTIAKTGIRTSTALQEGLWKPYQAPAIAGINTWINSPPLMLSDLKGKVVLIDFWTYSCINCVRTLPYLKAWYNSYHDKGLVIIGIHTPEFDFEKNADNVKRAVQRYGILYPVALDNQFATWRNFNNHYWPAHYLIDKNGDVVYEHFGEGEYDVTENNIRFLLGIDKLTILKQLNTGEASYNQTPETYLGYARADSSYSPYLIPDKSAEYHFPAKLTANAWALQGEWQVGPDKIVSMKAQDSLEIAFNARKIFIVMGSHTAKPIQVKVLLNGKPIDSEKGNDVSKGIILVDKHSLYEAASLTKFSSGVLQFVPLEPGLEIYAFTFGS